MLQMEVFILPSLFMVSGYKVYFWLNENNEPIHVHVSKGKAFFIDAKTKIRVNFVLSSGKTEMTNRRLRFKTGQFGMVAKWLACLKRRKRCLHSTN